jgi:threonine/homoserine/homoserine lactone efflux protein
MAAFAAFVVLLTIAPGLDTAFVVRTAAVSGRGAAVAGAAGVGLGCLAWAAASGLGITALLTASRFGYEVVRWGGAAYLVALGVRFLWRSRAAVEPAGGPAVPRRSAAAALRTGLLTNLLNPKVGVFYLAALPQFLPPGVNPLIASLLLGLVHVAEGLLWFALLIFAVRRAAGWLGRPAVKRRLDQLTGVVFIAFGVRLSLARAPLG